MRAVRYLGRLRGTRVPACLRAPHGKSAERLKWIGRGGGVWAQRRWPGSGFRKRQHRATLNQGDRFVSLCRDSAPFPAGPRLLQLFSVCDTGGPGGRAVRPGPHRGLTEFSVRNCVKPPRP